MLAIHSSRSCLSAGCNVRVGGSEQKSIGMSRSESDSDSLRDTVKELSEEVKRLSDRMDTCACSSLPCLPVLSKCDRKRGRRCCPALNGQPECQIIGNEKEPRCCIANMADCADVSKYGDKQCCNPDRSCMLKGSLRIHVCAGPTDGQRCLELGELCADRQQSCCAGFLDANTYFNRTCAPVEIEGTKALRCCVAHKEQCNPRHNKLGEQCCSRSDRCQLSNVPAFYICM